MPGRIAVRRSDAEGQRGFVYVFSRQCAAPLAKKPPRTPDRPGGVNVFVIVYLAWSACLRPGGAGRQPPARRTADAARPAALDGVSPLHQQLVAARSLR